MIRSYPNNTKILSNYYNRQRDKDLTQKKKCFAYNLVCFSYLYRTEIYDFRKDFAKLFTVKHWVGVHWDRKVPSFGIYANLVKVVSMGGGFINKKVYNIA
jgi:hypothetical protein